MLTQNSASTSERRFLQQPLDAVGTVPAFFIRGEGEDDIPIGRESLAFEADEVGDEESGITLNVLRATAVEVAILFEEFERVDGPVCATGFDDIEMGEEEDGSCGRLARSRATKLPFLTAGTTTSTSAGGNPAARRRRATASAAAVLSPEASVVSMPISSWRMACASS